MQKYQNNVTGRNGVAVSGVPVQINLADTATKAVIYSDDGVTPKANPMTTDGNGYFEFYVADGRYDIYVNGGLAYSDVPIADTFQVVSEAAEYAEAAATSASDAAATLAGALTKTAAAAPDGSSKIGKSPEIGSTAATVDTWLSNLGPLYSFAGVIRQTIADAGWSFINDSGHLPRGFNASSSFAANVDGTLTVPYGLTTYKVGAISVTGDETFAALGIAFGASVGNSSSTLSAFKTLDAAINVSSKAYTPSSFFAGKLTVAADGADSSVVVIDHPNCGSASVVPTITGVDINQAFDNRVISYASLATQVRVATFTPFYGYVSYNGSAFVVTTACKNKPTFSFDTGTGALTVTHEAIATSDAIAWVKERDDGTANVLDARVGPSTPTTFVVYFRDPATNAIVLAPSILMKFIYGCPASVRKETPNGLIAFKRENAKLDFAKVASGSGNIWMGGQMWKA